MKKIYYLLMGLVLCSSCNSDDTQIFKDTPEQRVEQKESELMNILTQPEHGWKMSYGTHPFIGQWKMLFKFNKEGKVNIQSEPINYISGITDKVTDEVLQKAFFNGVEIKHYGEDGKVRALVYNTTSPFQLNYNQHLEFLIQAYTALSIFNDIPLFDMDGDGSFSGAFAGSENQFIVDKYENGKLYVTGKANIGIGKNEDEIRHFIMEPALTSDWEEKPLIEQTKAIPTPKENSYLCLKKGKDFIGIITFSEPNFRYMKVMLDGQTQPIHCGYMLQENSLIFNNPLKLDYLNEIKGFNIDLQKEELTAIDHPDIQIVYSKYAPAMIKYDFNKYFNEEYVALDLAHQQMDMIGKKMKDVVMKMRKPYVSEQQITNIYLSRNMKEDYKKTAFTYPEELTLIFADDDYDYNDEDIYGPNAIFVHIPVIFNATSNKNFAISIKGNELEKAFKDAYSDKDNEYVSAKIKNVLPLIHLLCNSTGWNVIPKAGQDGQIQAYAFDMEEDKGAYMMPFIPFTKQDVEKHKQ